MLRTSCEWSCVVLWPKNSPESDSSVQGTGQVQNVLFHLLLMSFEEETFLKCGNTTSSWNNKGRAYSRNSILFGNLIRPFPIALSTFWPLFWLWSTILHFEHPWALFRTLGNIWAIFHISSNICLLKHFKTKTVCRSQRESCSRS